MERPRLRGRERYEARDDASGLPKVPAAERIDIDEEGKITGFFSWPSNKESGPRTFPVRGPLSVFRDPLFPKQRKIFKYN